MEEDTEDVDSVDVVTDFDEFVDVDLLSDFEYDDDVRDVLFSDDVLAEGEYLSDAFDDDVLAFDDDVLSFVTLSLSTVDDDNSDTFVLLPLSLVMVVLARSADML